MQSYNTKNNTTNSLQAHYPFTALVGQEEMCLALLLNAVNPAIGGVLIRGEKGTAKSTAARALALLLPDAVHAKLDAVLRVQDTVETIPLPLDTHTPFVELPIGASDDRVVGTLDIEAALRRGERRFEAGLLARVHGGILYVDEVNLLPDHLVDLLLDVAASGLNKVEREGISVVHPAQFILVGTMNPEEGELRPQLLDRFGLAVDVAGPSEPSLRAQVVRQRIAYESAPEGFAQRYAEAEAMLAARILHARERLTQVALDEGMLDLITYICAESGVDGLRADITMYKTARTLAAWHERTAVTVDDVRAAARLVLPHRRRRQPFEEPGMDDQLLEDLIQRHRSSPPPASSNEIPRGQSREPVADETEGD